MWRLFTALFLLTEGLAAGSERWLDDWQESVIHYESKEDLKDPVALLERRIENREVTLKFEKDRGYLKSLLHALQIPRSSQGLVFSKTSSQADWTSGRTPRALYFNDDVYVGWVQGGALEVAAVNPKSGSFFYTLTQEKDAHPKFERHMSKCDGCHDTSEPPIRLSDGS